MRKTVIIKELSRSVVVRIRVISNKLDRTDEVARFAKTGAAYCMLSAALRWYIPNLLIDEVEFHGTEKMAEQLTRMGVLKKSYDDPLTPVSS